MKTVVISLELTRFCSIFLRFNKDYYLPHPFHLTAVEHPLARLLARELSVIRIQNRFV